MSRKNILIGLVVIIVILALVMYSKNSPISTGINANSTSSPTTSTSKTSNTSGTVKIPKTIADIRATTNLNLPALDIFEPMLTLDLKGYSGVKITVEKVVFGRGDNVTSTGCTGLPNINFTTYLYPNGSLCISKGTVDGVPRGIVALHVLIENKGPYGFGGVDPFQLHYLRADVNGKMQDRFATALNGMTNNFLQPYTSKEVVLSYLVPQDQLNYDFLINYKTPLDPTPGKTVYDYSEQGLFLNFSTKALTIVKK